MNFSVLTLLLLMLNACNTDRNTKSDTLFANSNHPIREQYAAAIAGFNQRDLEVFLANFDANITMYGTDGVYFGIDALRNRFEQVFKQFPKAQMEVSDLELEALSETVILTNFKWKVYPMGRGPAYSGVGTGVYEFKANEWLQILEAETVTEMDQELMGQ